MEQPWVCLCPNCWDDPIRGTDLCADCAARGCNPLADVVRCSRLGDPDADATDDEDYGDTDDPGFDPMFLLF